MDHFTNKQLTDYCSRMNIPRFRKLTKKQKAEALEKKLQIMEKLGDIKGDGTVNVPEKRERKKNSWNEECREYAKLHGCNLGQAAKACSELRKKVKSSKEYNDTLDNQTNGEEEEKEGTN